MTDRTELRRLLDEASKGALPEGSAIPGTSIWIIVADAPALNLIRATSPKELRPILDQLDAAEAQAKLDRESRSNLLRELTEAREFGTAKTRELTAKLDAAEAALARVWEMHERESYWQYDRDQEHSYQTQQDAADESGCDCPEDPESTYLAHTAECLATITHFDVCAECARIELADADRQAHGKFSGYAEALWPCPTIAAIGGEQS